MLHLTIITLGIIASIGFISGNFVLERNKFLYILTFAMVVVSIQYSLLKVWDVPAVNAILIVRNFILLSKKMSRQRIMAIGITTGVVSLIAILLVTGIPTHSSGYLPLAASLFGAIAFSRINITWIKLFSLFASLSWVSLDIVYSNWQTLVGDGFSVLALLVALVRLGQLKKTNLIDKEPNK